jgi:nucleotide-binding universal stress UspA family protein
VRRYLVVANQTLAGDELVRAVVGRAEAQPSEFFVVVPATPVVEMWVEAAMLPYGAGPFEPYSPEQAREVAEERLQTALQQLRAAGATVHGSVCHPDPVRAVGDALRQGEFDEIIVSTLPRRISKWLRQDLPHRLEQFGLPVTHVTDAKHASS